MYESTHMYTSPQVRRRGLVRDALRLSALLRERGRGNIRENTKRIRSLGTERLWRLVPLGTCAPEMGEEVCV